MKDGGAKRWGLIAGAGHFPLEIADAARLRGLEVLAIAFPGLTDPALERGVDELRWLHLGELEKLLSAFAEVGIRDAVFAGKVSKRHLYGEVGALRPDARALELLAGLADRKDDSILGALADLLGQAGVALHPQLELVPELVAPAGPLGRCAPSPSQLEDLRFGWPIAKAIGKLDIGQTLVVEKRAVLALEAIEGTDEAIRRGGRLGGGGACAVKVAKPGQDPRFDLPAIGLGTLVAMLEAGVGALAFEASCTIILERSELVARADSEGIALLGVGPEGPPAAPAA
jgi:DUF1009 family protein